MTGIIDPVCMIHGMKWSEHRHGRCIYCGLCFVPLEDDECWVDSKGQKWDMCRECGDLDHYLSVNRSDKLEKQ